jgi:hypothetical protein
VGDTDQAHPHLPLRRLHRQRLVAERPVEPEVDVHDEVWAVHVEQVLAQCLGSLQDSPVHQGGRSGKSALGAGDRYGSAHVVAAVRAGEAV